MDMQLAGHRALVTGGSRGLGAAICRGLAAEGVALVINYHRQSAAAEQLAEELATRHAIDVRAVQADVACHQEVERMWKESGNDRPIDILVNNAATCPTAGLRELSEEQWRRTLATNLDGVFYCCRQFARALPEKCGGGRIVNISSQAAFRGSTSGHAPYDASKGGVVSLTVSLARELAPDRIAVNAIAAGMMETDMTSAALAAKREKYLNRIPLRRIGTTREIADAVVFLCSPRAAYITGATVDVSGGMLMR